MNGLDLTKHYEDVVRIVYAKFGAEAEDPDDLVHDVCEKILKLNQGSSPYVASRCAPSTYIYMVARGVLIKQLNRDKVPEGADTASLIPRSGHRKVCLLEWNEELLKGFEQHLKDSLTFEDTLPRRVFLLLRMGYTRKEICKLLDETLYQVKKQKGRLRDLAEDFIDDLHPSR